MLAPGIFREIFQMTDPNPRVKRRDDAPNLNAGENTRASSTSIAPPQESDAQQADSDTVDGWSSQTTEAPQKKRKQ